MSKKYKSPSKEAFILLAVSIGSCIYSLLAIISFVENGYVIIRHSQITGLFAYAVIFISVITALISGYMFRITRENESE